MKVTVELDYSTTKKVMEIAFELKKPMHEVVQDAMVAGIKAMKPKREHKNKYERKKPRPSR